GFAAMTYPVQLLTNDVDKFIQAVRDEGRRPAVVVVDTLARSFVGGEENSANDMGRLVAAADQIMRAFDCTVILVHHVTKNTGQTRGSSALPGAADTIFSVTKPARLRAMFKCLKQKDIDDNLVLTFDMVHVPLDDGESSLVPRLFEVTIPQGAEDDKAAL